VLLAGLVGVIAIGALAFFFFGSPRWMTGDEFLTKMTSEYGYEWEASTGSLDGSGWLLSTGGQTLEFGDVTVLSPTNQPAHVRFFIPGHYFVDCALEQLGFDRNGCSFIRVVEDHLPHVVRVLSPAYEDALNAAMDAAREKRSDWQGDETKRPAVPPLVVPGGVIAFDHPGSDAFWVEWIPTGVPIPTAPVEPTNQP
jgi:hypothetical protein